MHNIFIAFSLYVSFPIGFRLHSPPILGTERSLSSLPSSRLPTTMVVKLKYCRPATKTCIFSCEWTAATKNKYETKSDGKNTSPTRNVQLGKSPTTRTYTMPIKTMNMFSQFTGKNTCVNARERYEMNVNRTTISVAYRFVGAPFDAARCDAVHWCQLLRKTYHGTYSIAF